MPTIQQLTQQYQAKPLETIKGGLALPGINYDILKRKTNDSRALVITSWDPKNLTLNLNNLPSGTTELFVSCPVPSGAAISGGRKELGTVFFVGDINTNATIAVDSPAIIATYSKIDEDVSISGKKDIKLYQQPHDSRTITTSGGKVIDRWQEAATQATGSAGVTVTAPAVTPPSRKHGRDDTSDVTVTPHAKHHAPEPPAITVTTTTTTTTSTSTSSLKRTRDEPRDGPIAHDTSEQPDTKRHAPEPRAVKPPTQSTPAVDPSKIKTSNLSFLAQTKPQAKPNPVFRPQQPHINVVNVINVPKTPTPSVVNMTTTITRNKDQTTTVSTSTQFLDPKDLPVQPSRNKRTRDDDDTPSPDATPPKVFIPQYKPSLMQAAARGIDAIERDLDQRLHDAIANEFTNAMEHQKRGMVQWLKSVSSPPAPAESQDSSAAVDSQKQYTRHGIFVRPTGAGKTFIMAQLADIIVGSGARKGKVLVLVPSDTLRSQTDDSFERFANVRVKRMGGETGAAARNPDKRDLDNALLNNDVIIMTTQLLELSYLQKNISVLDKFDAVFVDEAHKGINPIDQIYGQVQANKVAMLAFTATPKYNLSSKDRKHDSVHAAMRLNEPGKPRNPQYADNPVDEEYFYQAVEKGTIAPVKCTVLNSYINLNKLPRKGNDDLSDAFLNRHLNTQKNNMLAIDAHLYGRDPDTKFPLRRLQSIVFCAGTSHADSVAKLYNDGTFKQQLDLLDEQLFSPALSEGRRKGLHEAIHNVLGIDLDRKFQVGKFCDFMESGNVTDEQKKEVYAVINGLFKGKLNNDNPLKNRDLFESALADHYKEAPNKFTAFLDNMNQKLPENHPLQTQKTQLNRVSRFDTEYVNKAKSALHAAISALKLPKPEEASSSKGSTRKSKPKIEQAVLQLKKLDLFKEELQDHLGRKSYERIVTQTPAQQIIEEIDADKSLRLNYARNLIREHFKDENAPRDKESVKKVIEEMKAKAMEEFQIAESVHGKMAKDKNEVLNKYELGGILALTGADMLIEGFDNPSTSITINLRPTVSHVMAQQRGGRSGRRYRFDETPLTEDNFASEIKNELRNGRPALPSNYVSNKANIVIDVHYQSEKQVMYYDFIPADDQGHTRMQCGDFTVVDEWQKNQVAQITSSSTKNGPKLAWVMAENEPILKFRNIKRGFKPEGTGTGESQEHASLVSILKLFDEVKPQLVEMQETASKLHTVIVKATKVTAQIIVAKEQKQSGSGSPDDDGKKVKREQPDLPMPEEQMITRQQEEIYRTNINEFTYKLRRMIRTYNEVINSLKPEGEGKDLEDDERPKKKQATGDKIENLTGGTMSDLKRLMLAKKSASKLLGVMQLMLKSANMPVMRRGGKIGVIDSTEHEGKTLTDIADTLALITNELIQANKSVAERNDDFLPPKAPTPDPSSSPSPPPLEPSSPQQLSLNEQLMAAVMKDNSASESQNEIVNLLAAGANAAARVARTTQVDGQAVTRQMTALEAAADHPDILPLIILLQNSTLSHQSPDKNTPPFLHYIVDQQPHMLPFVLENAPDLDVNKVDRNKKTAIKIAAEKGDENTVLMLRAYSAKLPSKQFIAALESKPVKDALGRTNVSRDDRDSGGLTRIERYLEITHPDSPLQEWYPSCAALLDKDNAARQPHLAHILARKGNAAGLREAIGFGVDYTSREALPGGKLGSTPYEIATASDSEKSKEVARVMLEARNFHNGPQRHLYTLIEENNRFDFDSMLHGNPGLLHMNIDDRKGDNSYTPLSAAAHFGRTSMVESLLKQDASFLPIIDRRNPLISAASANHSDIAVMIMDHVDNLTPDDWLKQKDISLLPARLPTSTASLSLEKKRFYIRNALVNNVNPLSLFIQQHMEDAVAKILSFPETAVNWINPSTGKPPLIEAIDGGVEQNKGIIDKLLAHPDIIISLVARDATNAYDHAVQSGDAALVAQLTAMGAKPSGRTVEKQIENIHAEMKLVPLDAQIGHYTRLITLDPDNLSHYENRGMIKYIRRDFAGATTDFDTVIERNNAENRAAENGVSIGYLGTIQGEQRNYVRAHELLNEAQAVRAHKTLTAVLAYRGHLTAVLAYRGHLKAQQGDYTEAFNDLNTSIRNSPTNATAYAFIGHYYIEQGEYTPALTNLNIALSEGQKGSSEAKSRALSYRGYVKAKQNDYDNDYDGALKDHEAALGMNPRSDVVHTYHALTLHHYLKHDEAMDAVEKALAINPFNHEAYSIRARIHSSLGNNERSMEDHDKAIELNPCSHQAYYHRGAEKALQQNDIEGAFQDAELAKELFTRHNSTRHNSTDNKKLLNSFKARLKRHKIDIDSIPHLTVPMPGHRAISRLAVPARTHERAATPPLHQRTDVPDSANFHQMIANCTGALQQNPEDMTSLHWRAHFRFLTRDLDGALKDCNEGLTYLSQKRSPASSKTKFLITSGQVKTSQGLFESAVSDFTATIPHMTNDDTRNLALLAYAQIQNRDYKVARGNLDSAAKGGSPNRETQLYTGLLNSIEDAHPAVTLPQLDEATASLDNETRCLAYSFRGVFNSKSGKHEEAISDHVQALKINPYNDTAHSNHACSLMLQALAQATPDYAPAIDAAEQALKLNPHNDGAHVVLGRVYYRLNNPELALQHFTSATVINPRNCDAYSSRGTVKGWAGDWRDAYLDHSKASRIDPANELYAEILANTTRTLNNLKIPIPTPSVTEESDAKQATLQREILAKSTLKPTADFFGLIDSYTKVIALTPNTSRPYTLRAHYRFAVRNFAGAIQDCSTGLDIVEKHGGADREELLSIRGMSYLESGNFVNARNDFLTMITHNPHSALANACMGYLEIKQRNDQQAQYYIGNAVKLDPNSRPAHLYAAQLDILNRKFDSAALHLNAVSATTSAASSSAEMFEITCMAYAHLARVKYLRNDTKKALAHHLKALEINPYSDSAHCMYAQTLYDHKSYTAAKKEVDSALEHNRYNDAALVILGRLSSHYNESGHAIAHFDAAIEINSRNHDAYRFRGEEKEKDNNLPGAYLDFFQSHQILPSDEGILNLDRVSKKLTVAGLPTPSITQTPPAIAIGNAATTTSHTPASSSSSAPLTETEQRFMSSVEALYDAATRNPNDQAVSQMVKTSNKYSGLGPAIQKEYQLTGSKAFIAHVVLQKLVREGNSTGVKMLTDAGVNPSACNGDFTNPRTLNAVETALLTGRLDILNGFGIPNAPASWTKNTDSSTAFYRRVLTIAAHSSIGEVDGERQISFAYPPPAAHISALELVAATLIDYYKDAPLERLNDVKRAILKYALLTNNKALTERYSDAIHTVDHNGNTLLHELADKRYQTLDHPYYAQGTVQDRTKHMMLINQLITAGADPHQLNGQGKTFLAIAQDAQSKIESTTAFSNNAKLLAKEVVDYAANLQLNNASAPSMSLSAATPAHFIVTSPSVPVQDKPFADETTALYNAAITGQKQQAKSLIASSTIHVDLTKETQDFYQVGSDISPATAVLQKLVRAGNLPAVQTLMRAGVGPVVHTRNNRDGKLDSITAAETALLTGRTDILKLFLSTTSPDGTHNADKLSQFYRRALAISARTFIGEAHGEKQILFAKGGPSYPAFPAVITPLLEHFKDASKERLDDVKKAILKYAVLLGNEGVIEQFQDVINEPDRYGNTLLHELAHTDKHIRDDYYNDRTTVHSNLIHLVLMKKLMALKKADITQVNAAGETVESILRSQHNPAAQPTVSSTLACQIFTHIQTLKKDTTTLSHGAVTANIIASRTPSPPQHI